MGSSLSDCVAPASRRGAFPLGRAAALCSALMLATAACGGGGNQAGGPDATLATDGGGVDGGGGGVDSGSGATANGTLSGWQLLPERMPLPRANHCAVAMGGYLVVIGGNYEPQGSSNFVTIDEVDVAKLMPDGSLGSWSKAGTTPSPVIESACAADGNHLYLIGGIYDDMADEGQVWEADLSADGVLGKFTSVGTLPGGRLLVGQEAWIADGVLYAVNDDLMPGAVVVLQASLGSSIGAWTVSDFLPAFRGRPQYAFTGKYMYTLGGYLSGANQVVTDAYGIPIDGTNVTMPFLTTAIPTPTTFGQAMAVDDYVFLVGGRGAALGGAGTPAVYSAPVEAGGQLGNWTAQASLPEGRTDHDLTLAGNYLYVTGGALDGPGVDTVFMTQVRFK